MFHIQSSVGPLLRALGVLEEDVERAKEAGLEAVAERGLELKLEHVEETYKRPPEGWARTGAFREGQTIEREPGRRIVGVRGAAEAYEERVANLKSGRKNPAARNAHRDLEEEALAAFERGVRKHLE